MVRDIPPGKICEITDARTSLVHFDQQNQYFNAPVFVSKTLLLGRPLIAPSSTKTYDCHTNEAPCTSSNELGEGVTPLITCDDKWELGINYVLISSRIF
jgi:hypothetical protein